MVISDVDPLSWFPYTPRPHQDRAILFASRVFGEKTVGLLSADCGVGKTMAVLSGYFSVRFHDSNSRLLVLTRTHSQSEIFENEIQVLRDNLHLDLIITSMVSRRHVCPMRDSMTTISTSGFNRSCAELVHTGRCTFYHNFYERSDNGRPTVRKGAKSTIEDLLSEGIVSRAIGEETALLKGFCPYEVLRWCAKSSNIVIGPYGYLFSDRAREAFLSTLNVDIFDIDILIDEAHNLPDHILNFQTAILSGEDLLWLRENKASIEKETGISWISDVVDFIWETMMLSLDELSGAEKKLNKWDIFPRYVDINELSLLATNRIEMDGLEDYAHAETPLDRLIDFLITASHSVTSEDWFATLELDRHWSEEVSVSNAKLIIRPLSASGLAAPILRSVRSALLMSGTLRPLRHYAELLGVKQSVVEDLSSPYDRGTRLVLLDRNISTKYTQRNQELWRSIAERINIALKVMPPDKSAIIAFPSYSIMEEVLSYGIQTPLRERVVETRKARLEELKEAVFEGSKTIFCVYGGKFSEGIDLVQNNSSLVNLIIGVGIPFSPPTTYQRALQDWYDKRFGEGIGYYYSTVIPSIRQVAQLTGRLRRSPEDWGVVLLLDNRFQRYLSVFGDDTVSDIWPYTKPKEIEEAISLFIQRRER